MILVMTNSPYLWVGCHMPPRPQVDGEGRAGPEGAEPEGSGRSRKKEKDAAEEEDSRWGRALARYLSID
jgi:hypothetical protein